jgi:hypothetical protein
MATGRQAFYVTTSAVIHDAILNRAPNAAMSLNPHLPPKLDETINKALEKDRDLRYQTAAELRADLKRLQRDTSSGRAVAAAAMSPSPPVGVSPSLETAVGTPPLKHGDSSDSQVITDLVKRHRKAMIGVEGDDGKFHVIPTVSTENWGFTVDYRLNKDCIMDLALSRFVTKATVEAWRVLELDAGERAKWSKRGSAQPVVRELAAIRSSGRGRRRLFVDDRRHRRRRCRATVMKFTVLSGAEVSAVLAHATQTDVR